MALPLAMICLAALTVMVLSLLTISGLEPQISQSLTDTARARYLAESGVEWAFKQVSASPVGTGGNFASSLLAGPDEINNTPDDQQRTNGTGPNTAAMLTALGSPSPLPTRSATEGTYSVTVRNDNLANDDKFTGVPVDTGGKFIDTNGIVIVTSTGTYRNASRTIQVAVKRLGLPPFPGAVNVPGFQAETFLDGSVNAGNANRYDIDGRDYDPNGTPNASNPSKLGIQVQPASQTDPGTTYEARVEQPFDDSARLGIVKGAHQATGEYTTGLNAIGPDAALSPALMSGFLSQIVSNPATRILPSTQACPMVLVGGTSRATTTPTITNGCGLNQILSLGTPSAPQLVYVRGDLDAGSQFAGLTINHMIAGAGILIVEDGDLQQHGNLRWDGLVIVTGKYVSAAFRSGSHTTIYGALTGLETEATESGGPFGVFLDDNIDFRVRSSKANVDMVQQMLSMHKILSWREN